MTVLIGAFGGGGGDGGGGDIVAVVTGRGNGSDAVGRCCC